MNLSPAAIQGTYVDLAYHPDGFIYGITSADQLWRINPNTGARVLVANLNGIIGDEQITGLTANDQGEMIGGGNDSNVSGHLYSLSSNGDITVLGELPEPCLGDLAYHKGDLYMSAVEKNTSTNQLTRNLLYKIDINSPGQSEYLGQVTGDVGGFSIVGLLSMPTSANCIDNILIAGATAGARYYEIDLTDLNSIGMCSYPNQLLGSAIESEYLNSKECECVERSCDDGDACTINDVEQVIRDTEIICEPCAGELVDCDSPGATEERSCDDGDPNTVNDVETILSCDGSVCLPCEGEELDCNTAEVEERSCDDGDACTINDVEQVVKDTDFVCEPCAGELVDCDSPGATEERSCDDGDPNTVNDVETLLSCDGSLCIPCRGLNQKGIYIPNAFTPNGDGDNDCFSICGTGIDPNEFYLVIYDRWGEIVFQTDHFEKGEDCSHCGKGTWNGRFSEKSGNEDKYLPVGQYYWYCKYKDDYGIDHEKEGAVRLIR